MNIKLRVGVLIKKGDKILLVKHKKDNETYWVLPGGKVEKGETLKETARREIKEELNLNIRVGRLIYLSEVIDEKKKIHIIDFFFSGKIIKGKPMLKSKDPVVCDFKFVEIEKLHSTKLKPSIAKHLKKAIKMPLSMRNIYLGNLQSIE